MHLFLVKRDYITNNNESTNETLLFSHYSIPTEQQ